MCSPLCYSSLLTFGKSILRSAKITRLLLVKEHLTLVVKSNTARFISIIFC